MATSIESETEENARWRLRPAHVGSRLDETLLKNEYAKVDWQQQQMARALRKMLEHCYDVVPYYRDLFQAGKIRRRHLREPGIIQNIPTLEKGHIDQHGNALHAQHLFPGQQLGSSTQTSGTTGQPTIILHSDFSLGMFRWLKQRELRWFRYDPMQGPRRGKSSHCIWRRID